MNTSIRSMFFAALMPTFLLTVGCSDDDNPVTPSQQNAQVRVIHASFDAPGVDVAVDGAKAISNLEYPLSSGYATLDAGTRNVRVTPAGANSPVVINADLNLEANKAYTVFAVNALASIEPVVVVDDKTVNASKAKVRFAHLSPDAPAVDIKVNSGAGATVFGNTGFKTVTNYLEVDAGTYAFAVTPAGTNTEVVVFNPIALENGKLYTVVALGTLSSTDNFPFSVRAFIDNDPGVAFADFSARTTARVLVVHASPDAPGVDLLVDGKKVGSNLTFPANTGYLDVTSGQRNIKVNVANTSTSVIDANVNLMQDKFYSIFASGAVANLTPLVLEDDLTAPAAGNAHVRFVHLSPDAPAVDITLTNGTIVFGNIAFRNNTAFTPLPSGTYDLQVRVAGTSNVVLSLPGIALSSGNIYTVFAKGFVAGTGTQALGAEIIVNK